MLKFLMEARQRGENPDFVPSPEQQRAINWLRLTEGEPSADRLIDYLPLPPFAPPQQ